MLEFKDGSSYEGEFLLMNFMEGRIYFSDGGVIKGNGQMDFYEGSWEFINGDKYEGEF